MSHNSSSANQPQIQASKKDKRGCRRSYLATGVNAIKGAKKDKEKAKDLSHIEYYTYKQKRHHINKCPKSQKTSGNLGNLHVNDWQKNEKKIKTGTLHLVFPHFERSNWGLIGLKKQSQCNESSFC